jgi:hypothetical protein
MKLAWRLTVGCPADVAANLATLELPRREIKCAAGMHALHAIRRRRRKMAVLFLDVDRFK